MYDPQTYGINRMTNVRFSNSHAIMKVLFIMTIKVNLKSERLLLSAEFSKNPEFRNNPENFHPCFNA